MTDVPLPGDTRASRIAMRSRASLLHFGCSLFVALLAGALVFGVWYPFPFRQISGGRDLFFLVVSVDVVLGPLVTFAIFDRRKPWPVLRRDLIVVVLLQLCGLAYGLHTVAEARPAYLVFEVDRFRVVRAIDIDPVDLLGAAPEYRTIPRWGPKLIMAKPPTEGSEVLKSIDMALAGRDINTQPKTWRPYEEARASVIAHAKPLESLSKQQPARVAQIEQAVAKTLLPMERIGYLPIIARETNWVALVDKQSANVVGYLPFGGF